ncbi:hypothetical protein [Pseudomonas rhodesiae]|uniref:hypothetical protein n=1 Tax=Pseudomonas rhodesiae TaxID=76760 RepID=UPI002898B739|nr:hypothetical protein [Pseudomonas rhodesiae]
MNLSAENIEQIRELVRSGYPLKARDAKDLLGHNDHLVELLEARGRLMLGVEIERDQLRAEVAGLKTGYEAYERVNAELKAENEELRANSSLVVLLPELDSVLEDLEIHGQHSDQGYRKLKDWYRKVDLACKAIDAAMGNGEQP